MSCAFTKCISKWASHPYFRRVSESRSNGAFPSCKWSKTDRRPLPTNSSRRGPATRVTLGACCDNFSDGRPELVHDTLDMNVERLVMLETNVDDLSPQVMAYAMEEILSAGALDAWCAPILMKKGRQGTMLGVLCESRLADTVIRIILTVRLTILSGPQVSPKYMLTQAAMQETTSLGVRVQDCDRVSMPRSIETISSRWGKPIRLKVARLGERIANVHAEYEDCARVARSEGVPLKCVFQEALDAYFASKPHL